MTPELTTTILQLLGVYYVMTRKQVQRRLPGFDDRTARKFLKQLVDAKLLAKTNMQVVNPSMGAPAPVFFLTRKGSEFLACATGDEKWLGVCTATPSWLYLYHWIQITEFRMILDEGISSQKDVVIENCKTEWQVVNPEEKVPEKRFDLYMVAQDTPRRIVFAPDLGFVVNYRGQKRAWYGEIDRMTTGIQQIAASKTPGYAVVAERKLWTRHFPDADKRPFGVLMVTLSAGRRDMLRKLIAEKPGGKLWRFASWDDLTPATILHESVFRDSEGNAVPLIKKLSPDENGSAASGPEHVRK